MLRHTAAIVTHAGNDLFDEEVEPQRPGAQGDLAGKSDVAACVSFALRSIAQVERHYERLLVLDLPCDGDERIVALMERFAN